MCGRWTGPGKKGVFSKTRVEIRHTGVCENLGVEPNERFCECV